MILTQAKATFGLNCNAAHSAPNVVGNPRIGPANATMSFPDADVAYAVRAVLSGDTATCTLDLLSGVVSGAASFVAGTAQLETATIVAAGGATSSGIMTLVLTSAGMTGSPLNIPVALTTATHTTAALIATAARAALAANTAVSARFLASGTGANIVLIRKPSSTIAVPDTGADGTVLFLFPATDGTLNLAIPSGLGVTAAGVSTGTAAGVATSGAKIYGGTGEDFEGKALGLGGVYGLLISNSGFNSVDVAGSTDVYSILQGEVMLRAGASLIDSDPFLSITADGGMTDVTITVIGNSGL